MILGMQMYGPIAAKGTMEMRELLKGLKEIGIGRIEPCISLDGKSGAPTFWQPEQCEEYFAMASELGLEVISAHVSAVSYEESMQALCELADKYGVKQFVVGTGGLSEAEIETTAGVYGKMADALAEHGAEVLIHNGKPDIAAKVNGKSAYEYLVDICNGKVAMQFDTGWAARGGEIPEEFIKRNAARIKSLHYKDFNMNIDTDVDTCIGDGTLNNAMYKQFALEAEIPQFIDADTYADVLADAKKSYDYVMSI